MSDTDSKFGKVAVLMGGHSAEREVSLKSGTRVLEALRAHRIDAHAIDAGKDVLDVLRREKFDRVFIALHGPWGEDGTLQGGLEVIGLPYTGSGVLGCAVAMDKLLCKHVWVANGIPVPPYVALRRGADYRKAAAILDYPLVVKPVYEGSSIGISVVHEEKNLRAACDLAWRYGEKILLEKYIRGAELTVAVLGERTLPIVRIETPREFYDYEAKYNASDTRYYCPSGLSAEIEKEVSAVALHAFKTIACRGWGRVDFIWEEKNAVPYVLEVNTVPGMTDHSLFPMAAKQAGVGFNDLAKEILMTTEGEIS